MADEKKRFIDELSRRFGYLRRLPGSQSLYTVADDGICVYIRYSKVHNRDEAFYGLREMDLRTLEGRRSFLCFLWNDQAEPLLIPYEDFEDVFQATSPASDGQYKALVYVQDESVELYIAQAGKFNVNAYIGWDSLTRAIEPHSADLVPSLSHTQVQTLLGAIGIAKGYDIWIPMNNRASLDWSLCRSFFCRDAFPYGYEQVEEVLREVDVLWIERGANELRAHYEVEHSTPIYSGLLRFNDIYLVHPTIGKFSIVANDTRRSTFTRQLNRPTFSASGLAKICSFLEYTDVFHWHKSLQSHT